MRDELSDRRISDDTWHKITNIGTEDLEFLTIWPIIPEAEGINGVYDERQRVWGHYSEKLLMR
jgi:hypothetical protein